MKVGCALIGTDHRRHLREEFPGRGTGREFGLEFVYLVIGHHARTKSLRLLSMRDMRASSDRSKWNLLQLN
jgi:hypothetical protein